jgi:DNA-binding MarR family transcriptional regulator
MSSMEKEPLSAVPQKDEVVASITALADRVAELEAKVAEQGAASLNFSDDKLATIASSIYGSRQMRADYFKGSLLTDPVWDMLLHLFVNKIRGHRVSTASLALATSVPQTTALRWIDVLDEERLLRRSAHEDARLQVVEITPEALQQMRCFIEDSVTRFDMPIPD